MNYPVRALRFCPESRPALRATIKVNNLSAWVDARLAGRDPEAILWHRIGKVGEEHGEAVTALIGLTDANPRRNTSSTTVDHLRYELLDVALAALAAHAHLGQNRGNPMQALLDHIDHVHGRAGLDAEDEREPCAQVENLAGTVRLLVRAECPDCGHHLDWHNNSEDVGCCFGWGDDTAVGCDCSWAGADLDQARTWMRVALLHASGHQEMPENPDTEQDIRLHTTSGAAV